MELSRNFTLQELIKSDTAIRKGIDNNPNAAGSFSGLTTEQKLRILFPQG